MNDILREILENKTAEEFAAEMSEVRKTIGPDNEYDISVEEVLGVTFDHVAAFKTIIVKIKTVSIAESLTMPYANEVSFDNSYTSYFLAA